MPEQNDLPATPPPATPHPAPAATQLKVPAAGTTPDDDRDDFIRNALPVASALRKAGKSDQAKQLEQVAQAIWQTKSLQPTPQSAPPLAPTATPEVAVKTVLADIWKAIEQDPALKNMPEAARLRRASERLDKQGLLSITMRNGVVVSFVSNFTENLARTQSLASPAPAAAKPSVSPAAASPTPQPAPQPAPVATPAAVAAAAPTTLAYTSYAPTTETGVIERRKTTPLAAAQMNVALTDKGEFGLNPNVNQKRLIGDGISKLEKFFDYEMPTSGLKITKVSLAESGQLQQTERGWEVVTNGKLALTDSAGTVFTPQLSTRPAVAAAPAAPDVIPAAHHQAPAPLVAAAPEPVRAGQAFERSELPAELLTKMGLSVELLERNGQLQKLLAGHKTDLLDGIKLPEPTTALPAFSAKLMLDRDAAGVVSVRLDLPKRELEIPAQVMGREVTPLMREQLQSIGVTPLAGGFRDQQGQAFTGYLAVDQEMKRVVAVRPEGIQLPKEVYGVKLTPQQSQELLEGRPARIEGMTNAAKQLVDAVVQLDPLNRKLIFRDTRPRLVPELTPVQPPAPTRRRGVSV